MIRGVSLLVAARCNLACAYCYQTRRSGPARMSWRTARAALDAALRLGGPAVAVELSGGEPWLNPGLVRRVVRYLATKRPPGTGIGLTVTTNGTLLTPADVELLAARGVTLALSCDGTVAAQTKRGRGTFTAVDGLLDHLREARPEYLRAHVRVSMTVTGANVGSLAAGVAYLLAKGVPEIRLGVRLTPDPDWSEASPGELRREVGAISTLACEHWERSGEVPVAFLASPLRPSPRLPPGLPLCGAPLGASVCVDTAGRVWGCPLFASSLQELPHLARGASKRLDFGDIADPALPARLRRRRDEPRLPRAFTHLEEKHSSYGRCGDCELAAGCAVCPAGICLAATDPDVVPDEQCAFNRVTAEGRRRFAEMTRGAEPPPVPAAAVRAVRALRDALAAERLPLGQAAPPPAPR